MLLWINGPFGGGKTQTAHELARRLPGSHVCDPEVVGFGLHKMTPPALRGDFQDLPAWRQGVFEVLDLALSKQDGTVIAPMTVIEPAYFAEIVGRLRDRGHDVRHFALLASREVVLDRLRERVFGHVTQVLLGKAAPLRRESWAVRALDKCLDRLAGPEFAEHLWTDDITVAQVADRIAESAGLALTPYTDGPLRGRVRRAWVGVRHIRF
ncbi:AAA family ATPase [Actinosynnema sp. NPDC047251]|uniref:TmrB-like protein n=1 Tax=Saccharothrix espanaensis (strain ATCC 51144 / DSM 44229 / JCM 9112 / NBRC 15066 / NRRL 15764) TaxID=1179773 RepID=K0K1U0_SACES|nr:AAA family ATPase [Saccharothrix espanaensis]CCH31532.1 TmrB-like protein [Saccharothrix espanaensis DSM 44229]